MYNCIMVLPAQYFEEPTLTIQVKGGYPNVIVILCQALGPETLQAFKGPMNSCTDSCETSQTAASAHESSKPKSEIYQAVGSRSLELGFPSLMVLWL